MVSSVGATPTTARNSRKVASRPAGDQRRRSATAYTARTGTSSDGTIRSRGWRTNTLPAARQARASSTTRGSIAAGSGAAGALRRSASRVFGNGGGASFTGRGPGRCPGPRRDSGWSLPARAAHRGGARRRAGGGLCVERARTDPAGDVLDVEAGARGALGAQDHRGPAGADVDLVVGGRYGVGVVGQRRLDRGEIGRDLGVRLVVGVVRLLRRQGVAQVALRGPVLGPGTRPEEGRNRDGNQNRDDEHNDHQLDEREAVLTSPLEAALHRDEHVLPPCLGRRQAA